MWLQIAESRFQTRCFLFHFSCFCLAARIRAKSARGLCDTSRWKSSKWEINSESFCMMNFSFSVSCNKFSQPITVVLFHKTVLLSHSSPNCLSLGRIPTARGAATESTSRRQRSATYSIYKCLYSWSVSKIIRHVETLLFQVHLPGCLCTGIGRSNSSLCTGQSMQCIYLGWIKIKPRGPSK